MHWLKNHPALTEALRGLANDNGVPLTPALVRRVVRTLTDQVASTKLTAVEAELTALRRADPDGFAEACWGDQDSAPAHGLSQPAHAVLNRVFDVLCAGD